MAIITGTAGKDVLIGTDQNDIIYGLNSDDVIDGGLGADTMNGGEYNDVYYVDNVGDVIVETSNGGQDMVKTKLNTYTLPQHVEWLEFIGAGSFHGIGNAGWNWLVGGSGNDLLDGGGGQDTLQGGAGDDTYIVDVASEMPSEEEGEGIDTVKAGVAKYQLQVNLENLIYTGPGGVRFEGYGNQLDNRIEGGSGDDVLDGGWGGLDTLIGYAGDDYYIVREASDVVVEGLGQGEDDVLTYATTYTLSANVEELYAASADSPYTLTGNALNNHLGGAYGDDVLNGMAGDDVMQGLTGNDIYYADREGDRVEENENGGIDRVYTTAATYLLRSNVEELVYTGDQSVGAQLGGNAQDNYLKGGGANDTLSGNGGSDRMEGLGGNDTYWVDSSGDHVIEATNGGEDFAWVSVSFYQMAAGLEDVITFGGGSFEIRGNALANRIETSVLHDTLDGGAGADELIGWDGNDVYIVDNVGDQVVEEEGNGNDTVKTTLFHYNLGANVENLTYVGEAGKSFLAGGNALANTITGGSGDDFIDGDKGADTLVGAAGDDRYWVDTSGDNVVEKAGEGVDHVTVAAGMTAFTLAENVEQLLYHGPWSFKAVGNAGDNLLTTGGGSDDLDGGLGADRMVGGFGNDIYRVDNAGDLVVENSNEGIDIVWATLSAYTLAANVEKLVYGGAFDVAFTAVGNALDNFIEAGEAADYIDGGAGADTMNGRGGNDVYVVDHVGDMVGEYWGGGTDEIRTALGSRTDFALMYTLAANVENLTGTSSAGQGVYANALDNIVKMGAGGDLVVMQGGGIDRVESGGGDDFIYWGSSFTSADANDGGAGYDTVGLAGHYSLTLAADDLAGIEKLALYSAGGFGLNMYNITTADANVAAGQNLMVVGLSLTSQERLTFNGSAETDGSFNIRGGKGEDALAGGAKADQLYGNLGADTLWGGAGKDQFEYFSAAESTHFERDHIMDFTTGDRINLTAIDADNNAANGNSKFAFIGSEFFGGVAGQLRAVNLGGQWLIEGDLNGDTIADLSIMVTTSNPAHVIAGSDFYL